MSRQEINYFFNVSSGAVKTTLVSLSYSRDELAIVFPGSGYSVRMPYLYYSIECLLLKDYKVLVIEKLYSEDLQWKNLNSQSEAFKYVKKDIDSLAIHLKTEFDNKIKVLVGKSLGTFQIACLLESQLISPTQIVWLTPFLSDYWNVMKSSKSFDLGVIGSRDALFTQAETYLPTEKLIFPDADHSLNIEGNVFQSIQFLESYVQKLNEFILPAG